jgi:RNA polymerase sigma-70 factor (ECF subfamily)
VFEASEAERALVAACARREHAAFERLLAIQAEAIRAGCRRALGRSRGRADLDEAEAEVLKRLWEEAEAVFGGFRFACSLEAWLRLVAYRTALNWASARGRRSPGWKEDTALAATSLAQDALEVEERLEGLRRGLERLEIQDRALLEDAYLKGSSYKELSQRHGVAPGSVGSLLTRARRKLAGILKTLS